MALFRFLRVLYASSSDAIEVLMIRVANGQAPFQQSGWAYLATHADKIMPSYDSGCVGVLFQQVTASPETSLLLVLQC